MRRDGERRAGLCLRALDALFFRDGRPFGAAARVLGGLPLPQTLAGALRTALLAREGFDFAAFSRRRKHADPLDALRGCGAPEWILTARFRGPWLALQGCDGHVEPLLPVPQTLARSKGGPGVPGTWVRADPLAGERLPGWDDRGGLLPLWRKGPADAKHPGGFLTPAGVKRFLAGGVPEDGDWLELHDLCDFDLRTGIAISPETLTAGEGEIYGVRLLVPRRTVEKKGPSRDKEIRLYSEVILPGAAPADASCAGPLPLGGEGRYAVGDSVAPVNWDELQQPGGLWLLATPGRFGAAAPDRPDRISEGRLRAAASGPPLAVSGWDVARGGPKPTRFAVPAGAVYFVDGDLSLPDASLCADGEDAAQGWGFALRGARNS